MTVNNSHNDGARETNKIKNRQAIIEAGIQTFIAKGVAETTVRDIIRSTGLASGTFYNYFNSKEEVLVAIFDDFASIALPQTQCSPIRDGSIMIFNDFLKDLLNSSAQV